MEEHWKDIAGYEGKYQVSDWGNVRSLNYHQTGKPKLLKPFKKDNKKDYLKVSLCKDGKVKRKFVHRLVAEAFIPNPNHLQDVNHKSECPMLNFACVLEWCDRKYNNNYGTVNQRRSEALSKPVVQYDRDGNFIRRWKSLNEASRQLGISCGGICECLKNKRKTLGGFVWQYATDTLA